MITIPKEKNTKEVFCFSQYCYQLLNALTSFYLIFPLIFFSYGWLKQPFSFITIFLILCFLIFTSKNIYVITKKLAKKWLKQKLTFSSVSWIIFSIITITAWVSLSGIGGIGLQNDDYRASNALLSDLILQDWPLISLIDGNITKIVYYMAYYLPAAAVGKIFGWTIANIIIFLWSLVGVFFAFAWFLILSRRVKHVFAIASIFCLAGGLDFISVHITKTAPLAWDTHIEIWAKYFQYSSNTTLLYWVPQHSIPIWLITGMVVGSIRKKRNNNFLGVALAASILWSPFGLVGIFPYLILGLAVYSRSINRNLLINKQTIFFNGIAIWLGGIISLYIMSNNFAFPTTYIWKVVENNQQLILILLKFWLVEFGFLASLIIIYLLLNLILDKLNKTDSNTTKWFVILNKNFEIERLDFTIFLISMAILIILPFFKLGIHNDLVMRSSIPALFIFWTFVSKILLHKSTNKQLSLSFLRIIISAIMLLGFLTSSAEILRSINHYQIGPPSLQAISSTEKVNQLEIVLQRTGNDDTFFYRYIGK